MYFSFTSHVQQKLVNRAPQHQSGTQAGGCSAMNSELMTSGLCGQGASERKCCPMALKTSHLEVTQMTSFPSSLAGTSHMTLKTAKVLEERRYLVSCESAHQRPLDIRSRVY